MAKRGKSWVNLLLLAGAVLGVWQLGKVFFGGESGSKRLLNQLWLERMPRDERDMVYATVLIEHEKHRVGVVARGSRWRGYQDAFVWRLEGDRLRARFPQDDKRYQVTVKTWECEGQVPRPFQLCLEVRNGDQSLRFFSRKDWVVRPHGEALPPEVAGLEPSWSRALAAAADVEVGEGGIEAAGLEAFGGDR